MEIVILICVEEKGIQAQLIIFIIVNAGSSWNPLLVFPFFFGIIFIILGKNNTVLLALLDSLVKILL